MTAMLHAGLRIETEADEETIAALAVVLCLGRSDASTSAAEPPRWNPTGYRSPTSWLRCAE